jgi:cysteine desulfurase
MIPYFGQDFGNPSSKHAFGIKTKQAAEESTRTIDELIGAEKDEIYFTSSGTESNNLAIIGVAKANKNKGNHIITSNIEHPSVLNVCKVLEKDGYNITCLPVDKNGSIILSELEKAITSQTVLVTTHYGNSEIGTLQDIQAIGAICRGKGVYLHIDACQSIDYEKIDVADMNIDLLTLNSSKMYGPKGVAVLYVNSKVSIFPIIYGSGQQKSLRSGTENVPGIIGIAKAAEIILSQREDDARKVKVLRDELEKSIENIEGVSVNAKNARRLPNHLSVCLENRTNSDIVREMDDLKIAVSAGSACSSTAINESYVLSAIGLTSAQAQATIRITLGRNNSERDTKKITEAIRAISTKK